MVALLLTEVLFAFGSSTIRVRSWGIHSTVHPVTARVVVKEVLRVKQQSVHKGYCSKFPRVSQWRADNGHNKSTDGDRQRPSRNRT